MCLVLKYCILGLLEALLVVDFFVSFGLLDLQILYVYPASYLPCLIEPLVYTLVDFACNGYPYPKAQHLIDPLDDKYRCI